MSELLPGMQSEARSRDLSQFYTPPWLAERVARWACLTSTPRFVLEPAAGRGALVAAIRQVVPGVQVSAWDIDRANVEALQGIVGPPPSFVVHGNFLKAPCETGFDLALLNPPYEDNQDVQFIERAVDCSARAVGIYQSRIVHSEGRWEFWRWHDMRRRVNLSKRPHFGGPHSARTDFVVLEILRRATARKQGEATPVLEEWW